jgi:hypothetical protein
MSLIFFAHGRNLSQAAIKLEVEAGLISELSELKFTFQNFFDQTD